MLRRGLALRLRLPLRLGLLRLLASHFLLLGRLLRNGLALSLQPCGFCARRFLAEGLLPHSLLLCGGLPLGLLLLRRFHLGRLAARGTLALHLQPCGFHLRHFLAGRFLSQRCLPSGLLALRLLPRGLHLGQCLPGGFLLHGFLARSFQAFKLQACGVWRLCFGLGTLHQGHRGGLLAWRRRSGRDRWWGSFLNWWHRSLGHGRGRGRAGRRRHGRRWRGWWRDLRWRRFSSRRRRL